MKNVLCAVSVLLSCCSLSALAGGERVLLSDDFSQPEMFAERWESMKTGKKAAICENGCVRLVVGAGIRWAGKLPLEFVCEATLVFPADEAGRSGPRWGGFTTDYGSIFHVWGGRGVAVVLPRKPARGNRYAEIPGYVPGKPVTIELTRRKAGTMMKYICRANGTLITTFTGPVPENPHPLEITAFNLECEVRSVKISAVAAEDSSPNMIVNSGFEYDEDGLPPFVQILGSFDWPGRPSSEYEAKYLKRVSIDRTERHSGKQSLRLVADCGRNCEIRPFGVPPFPDARGVFSVWAKAAKADTSMNLRYGGTNRTFKVGTDWARYELFSDTIGGPSVQSIAALRVHPEKDGTPATVWVDDWQVELVEGKTATPYRPLETDAERFAPKPTGDFARVTPKPLSVAENALNGYTPKAGETVVLGRLNFYMNEPEAKFRIWRPDGTMTEHAVDIRKLPVGSNIVTVAGEKATVVKRPYRDGATQINFWTRSLVHGGENILFTAPCVLSLELGFRFAAKNGLPGLPIVDFLHEKGFRYMHFNVHNRNNVHSRESEPTIAARLLDHGAKKGMLFDVWTDHGVEKMEEAELEAYWGPLDRPNVLVRQILDEPELRGKDDAWAREAFRRARKRFPDGAIMLNGSGLQFDRDFAGGETDVFMLDAYLTNNPDGRTVAGVVSGIDRMRGKRPGTPAWYFVVSDNLTLHYKAPSYGEQVAQSWGVLAGGGSGLSWYLNMPHTEPCWRAMLDVNREAQEQKSFLLSEEACGGAAADVGKSVVRVLTRRVGADWRVFACNLDVSAVKGVNFALPDDAPQNGTVEVLYENRTLPLKDGRFTDDFAGHTRHIYRLKRGK